MKTRLIAASFLALGFVACGAHDAEDAATSEHELAAKPALGGWVGNPKEGTLIPTSCEKLSGAEVPAAKGIVYAHGPTVSCGSVRLLDGRWTGAATFNGTDPGFCTFQWSGGATPDFQGLIGTLPEG